MTLVILAFHLKAFEDSLSRVAAGAEPVPSRAVHRRPDGQILVDVIPASRIHALLFSPWGLRGQVWMQPGVDEEQVRADAAHAYRGSGFEDPGVALVLGAGNFSFLPATDTVHMLVARGCVVALKLNPLNAYLRPFLERIFVDFRDRGWLRFVEESAEVGAYLAHHPGVDRLHMTGSAATYDALVWGTGPEGLRNRAEGTPRLDKPFTAELGGVNPVIVVPGPWSDSDVRLQADRIAWTKVFACGHQCVASQILVLPEGWPNSDALIQEIRTRMRALTTRTPYYPGTQDKVARALAGHPDAEPIANGDRQWLVTGLDPGADESLFHDEVFADVLGVVSLPAPTVPEYLATATTFANQRLAGNLASSVYVHPTTAKQHAAAVDRTIAGLRFGVVAVNEVPNYAMLTGHPTWGAFPGNTREDIASGIGTVGNGYLLAAPEKAVLSAWFHPPVKPSGTASNQTMAAFARGLMTYATTDDLRALPGVVTAALRA